MIFLASLILLPPHSFFPRTLFSWTFGRYWKSQLKRIFGLRYYCESHC